MRNYVIINGVSSLTISGLAIRELPAISKTLMRNQKEEIDGRDGDIITELGYSAYDKTMTIGLYGSYDINQIIAFFNQKGTIVFSDEADKYYNFTILEKIDYDKLVKFRTATVKMHIQPFKYPVSETPVEIEAEYVTAEAEDITLNNTGVAPLEIGLKGNTYQETTTGKNLFSTKYSDYDTTTDTYGFRKILNEIPSGKNLVISLIDNDTSVSLGNDFYLMITSDGTISSSTRKLVIVAGVKSEIASAFYTDTLKYISFYPKTETAFNKLLQRYKIQYELVDGTTPTAYEPYTNGASPNPDYPQEVQVVTGDNTIKVCNENIQDNDWAVGRYDGSATGTNVHLKINNGNLYQEGHTYTIQFKSTNSNYASKSVYLQNVDSQVNLGAIAYDSTKQVYYLTRTLTSGDISVLRGNQVRLAVYVSQGVTTGDITNGMIFEGNTPTTDYIAHQSQEYEINLGKNLFNLTNGTYSNHSVTAVVENGTITLNGTADANSFIDIPCTTNYEAIANKTYSLSANNDSIKSGGMIRLNANGTYDLNFASVNNKKTITISSDKIPYLNKIIIRSDSGTSYTDFVIKPQLEVGDQATTYSPYFTPIELCKIGTYQDYLYKSGENWYKHTEIGKHTFIGNETENWSKYTNTDSQGNTYGFNISLPNTPLQVTNASNFALSNYFKQNNRNAVSIIDTKGIYLGSGDTFFLKIDQSLVSGGTTTNLKTWLSTHNTIVYYVLATPTEEQITNAELIEQLNAILNAVSYEDQTNISQENDNMAFILDVSALKKGTDMAVVNNGGNIAAKPIIAVKGNGTLGIYLDNTQMFSLNMTSDITIDTENMEAYDPNTSQLRNRQVTGDYSKFALQPGNNTIKVTGDFTSVTISKYKRWL